jgi:hypothetical protein
MEDLYPVMSAELQGAVEGKRRELLSQFAGNSGFVGYTVSVVTINVDELTIEGGTAHVTMQAEREVSGGAAGPVVEYVTYGLSWARGEDGRWSVHGITGTY